MFGNNPKKLYKKFEEALNSGSEGELETFLREKYSKLPKDMQDQVTIILLKKALEEAISKDKKDQSAIERFQENGLKTLKKLERMKEILKDRKKELSLKESLNNSKN